jgi:hypothetical protein
MHGKERPKHAGNDLIAEPMTSLLEWERAAQFRAHDVGFAGASVGTGCSFRLPSTSTWIDWVGNSRMFVFALVVDLMEDLASAAGPVGLRGEPKASHDRL